MWYDSYIKNNGDFCEINSDKCLYSKNFKIFAIHCIKKASSWNLVSMN